MLSKRLSIQWVPEEPHENTSTMVVYSNESHFVDIRVFNDHYPIVEDGTKTPFSDVFEWVMTGDEVPVEATIPNTYVIKFTHEIDSMAVMKSISLGKPVEECIGADDVGTFWNDDSTLDRKETGCMVNPATNQQQNYVEMWRSLNAMKHSPEKEVRELSEDNDDTMYVLRTLEEEKQFQGQLIRTGNWCQGVIYDKSNEKVPLNVIRSYFDGEKWQMLINYGSLMFPVDFHGDKNDTLEISGIKWKCIEH